MDWTNVTREVVIAISAAVVLWLIGVPGALGRMLLGRIKRSRVGRKLAVGVIDDSVLQAATRYYIRQQFSNVDPANEAEPATALINARADLFSMVDQFLATGYRAHKHLLVFADSGMGKTSFLLNYLAYNYRWTNLSKKRIFFVPLSQQSADEIIKSVSFADRPETNLFLDALDEDPRAIGSAAERLEAIITLCEGFRSVVITCRSQFFSKDDEIPVRTSLAKAAPVPLGRSKYYEFLRVYLAPFSDKQVAEYLRRRFPGILNYYQRWRARQLVRAVPSLAVRPMLLAHFPDVLGRQERIRTAADIYRAMVDSWCARESAWIDPGSLIRLSSGLAVDLYMNRRNRGREAVSPIELEQISRSLEIDVSRDLVTSRSLLNRTAAGYYKFAHRSIMEYFVVDWVLEERPREPFAITDQMAVFLLERLGCLNNGVQEIVKNTNVSVKFVDEVRCHGVKTSYSLYSPVEFVEFGVSIADLLKLPCAISHGTTPARNLNELVSDLCTTSFGVDVSQADRVVLLLESQGRSPGNTIYVAAWTNRGVAICEITVSKRALRDAFHALPQGSSSVMLTAVPAKGTNLLERANWSVGVRVKVPGWEAPRVEEYVGLEYVSGENQLHITVLDVNYLAHAPLCEFGLFGEPHHRRAVPNRPYALIGSRYR